MATINNGLKGKNVPQKIIFGETVHTALTGNPNVTIDPLKMTELDTNWKKLKVSKEDVDAAKSVLRQKTEDQDANEKLLNKTLSDIANIINGTLNDPAKLATTGFPLSSEAAPIELTQVQNLSITSGDDEGELDLHWDPVSGATGYSIALTTDIMNPETWKIIKSIGRTTKYSIKNLTSGTKYWVRVAAVRGDETAAPSDPATKIAP